MTAPRTAIIHDWLDTWRGGENVLAEIIRAYPSADLFAVVDFLPPTLRPRLAGKHARTTFIQHLPWTRRHFRTLLPLFPAAIESLDLTPYDLVISSSHAVAKGVRTAPSQLHICYCHTPMRYAWDLRAQYLGQHGIGAGVRGAIVNVLLDRLRDWDRRVSNRVTRFVANSGFVRDRIARCYGRDAVVIHPPVDTVFFTPAATPVPLERRDYYFAASRWVPYKRMDLIVRAFGDLPERRLIVAGDGPEAARVRAAAGPNVEFVGEVPGAVLRDLLRGARAFVFAAEEDFGILPVEAQATGTPVIAYGRGGARETVVDVGLPDPTGLLFDEQAAPAIAAAVRRFEARLPAIDPLVCRTHALGFSTARFTAAFTAFVAQAQHEFASGSG